MKYFILNRPIAGNKLFIRLIFLQLFFSSYVLSGQESLRFNHLTSDQGLTSSSTQCLLKDHNGFLWIGTNAGLNRFDGNTVFPYSHQPGDSTSLPIDDINCLFEDSRQRIWIATPLGFSILYPESEEFINYSR